MRLSELPIQSRAEERPDVRPKLELLQFTATQRIWQLKGKLFNFILIVFVFFFFFTALPWQRNRIKGNTSLVKWLPPDCSWLGKSRPRVPSLNLSRCCCLIDNATGMVTLSFGHHNAGADAGIAGFRNIKSRARSLKKGVTSSNRPQAETTMRWGSTQKLAIKSYDNQASSFRLVILLVRVLK